MADYEDTKVNDLIINNMSQEKFNELKDAGELDPTQLYCTPEEGGASLPDLLNKATSESSIKIIDAKNADVESDLSGVDKVVLGYKATGTGLSSVVAIGAYSSASGDISIAVGKTANARADLSIAIGPWAYTYARRSIQLGYGDNNDANTFKVSNDNGNFEMMSADGTIPLDRLKGVAKQFSELPSAETYSGKIVQYTGTTNTHGAFYEAVSETTQELNAGGYRTDGSITMTVTVDKEKFLAQSPSFNETYGNAWRADYTGTGWNVWSQEPNITISAADLESVWGITITSSDGTYTPAGGDSLQITLIETTTHDWKEIKFGETLPDQTGNAGKFLTTDGTTTSWGNALVNSGSTGLGISKDGEKLLTAYNSIAIGTNASATSFSCIGIGSEADGSAEGGVAVGTGAKLTSFGAYGSVAIGCGAKIGSQDTVHIRTNRTAPYTIYSVESSFGWTNRNGTYTLFDANGNIPVDRLGNVVEVLPEESNNFTTVKNFGQDYVEITGFAYVGVVGAGTGSEIVIEFPEGYNMRDGNYWVNVSCTSESSMFDFKAEVKSRSTNSFFVAYKNEDDTNGLEGAGIFWEVRGMLVPRGA